MTTLKQMIEEYNGPRCDDYEPGCVVCQIWHEYDELIKHQKDHAMEEEMHRLVNWMVTLPTENQITLMSALVKENPSRLNTAAASNWAKNNAIAIHEWQHVKVAKEMNEYNKEQREKAEADNKGPWPTPRSFKSASEALRAKKTVKFGDREYELGEPEPSEYGWVFDENGKERPITKEEHDRHERESAEYLAKVETMSGRRPGRGKSDFIKDIPGVKTVKLRKTRKYDTKGFQRKPK